MSTVSITHERTWLTSGWLAMEAASQCSHNLPGWDRPITIFWLGERTTIRKSGWFGEPLILNIGDDILPADEIDAVQQKLFPYITRALESEIWPYIWAKAMMGPPRA